MTAPTDLLSEILDLKRRRRAVILAHNYQLPEVQDAADYVGDSLGLSREAARTQAEVIVFCGVYFMAETAALLNPGKTVLIPDPGAGCPMADMITARQLRAFKAAHPGAAVVCYVNSTAEVKAESDICCTSANSAKIVSSVPPGREILFVPDKYLGTYTMSVTGRPLVLWNGYCPTHVKILPEYIRAIRESHPRALVLAHPECTPAVTEIADKVLSTDGLCRFVRESNEREFIVATENGMLHRLRKENPGKTFLEASPLAECPNMKRVTLEKVCDSLRTLQTRVEVAPEIRGPALAAVERMLAVS